MFVDFANISLQAGRGGDGCVSFHREKYIASGGPDGGDGGRGGDILFKADDSLSTLADFRYKKAYKAESGQAGRSGNSSGRSGASMTIRVPRGTLIRDVESGRLLADLSGDEPFLAAKGGRGGAGNQHFATSTRQAPRFAKPGAPGEALEVTLELKLLADVGLIGYPNVGKSTLITAVSGARPQIANYPFTTLTPVLGVVRIDEGSSYVMADIPGLIEGAGGGAGLGHEFLRHVERCRLLVHLVDVSGSEGRDPKRDFEVICGELAAWGPELAARPQIVAGNKCDLAGEETIESFRAFIEERGLPFFAISAAARQGVDALRGAIAAKLAELPPVPRFEPDAAPPVDIDALKNRGFTVRVQDGVFFVEAPWLSAIMNRLNPNDEDEVRYFDRLLTRTGIIAELRRQGLRDGGTVDVEGFEFDYVE